MQIQSDIWAELKQKLPYEVVPEQTALRKKYWSSIDVNGNGYLSLSEVDKGMRDVIKLPALFNLKPVLIRAFNAAKNKLPSKNLHGDDYVSRAEFRYLLKFLRQYYEYWVAFDRIDSNDDRRVSLDEFIQAVPMMEKWGLKIKDPVATFKEVDADGKGQILFIEFCTWAIRINLDIDDDDDAL